MNVVLIGDETFQIRWWSHKWHQIKIYRRSQIPSHFFIKWKQTPPKPQFPKGSYPVTSCALAHLNQIQTVGGVTTHRPLHVFETTHRPLLVLRLPTDHSSCWDYPQTTPRAETTHRQLLVLRLPTNHSLCWDYPQTTPCVWDYPQTTPCVWDYPQTTPCVWDYPQTTPCVWDYLQATPCKEAAAKALCNPPRIYKAPSSRGSCSAVTL